MKPQQTNKQLDLEKLPDSTVAIGHSLIFRVVFLILTEPIF